MARGTLENPDVAVLRQALPLLPEPLARPVFVVMVGLPGSGKSFFSRQLVSRFPMALLETDLLRKALFPNPTYSPEESNRLFRAVHDLAAELLGRGIPVLLDATNLVESHREHLYHIAEKVGALLVLVRVYAPEGVVRERLARREMGRDPEDHSEADWRVYQRMRSSLDPIRRNFFAVDTSQDITPALDKILRTIRRWLRP